MDLTVARQLSRLVDQIATIIAETCDIPRDTITPESHAIDDLGIDSLDFLDMKKPDFRLAHLSECPYLSRPSFFRNTNYYVKIADQKSRC